MNVTSDAGHIMKIEYKVSQDGLRIETFPKGVLDIKETIDYFGMLKNDKKIKQVCKIIKSYKLCSRCNVNWEIVGNICWWLQI